MSSLSQSGIPATPLILYGGEHSLYTGKARAYLKWAGLNFQEMPGTTDVLRNIIIPQCGWPVMPVLYDETNNLYVQDTSDIIDYCEYTYGSQTSKPFALPPLKCTKQRLACYFIELIADQYMNRPAMHYRWSFPDTNEEFLIHEWTKLSATDEQHFGESGDKIRKRMERNMKQFGGSIKGLGINKKSIPAIETSYLKLLKLLEEHFKYHAYLLGGRPCLADFAFMGPMYAHLYRDPYPSVIMKNVSPRVAEWVERMNQRNLYTGKIYDPDHGKLCNNDTLPKTLIPVLNQWFNEYMPLVYQTAVETRKFLRKIGNTENYEMPRVLPDPIDYFVEGVKTKCRAATFDMWMLQRFFDEVNNVSSMNQSEIESFYNIVQGNEEGVKSYVAISDGYVERNVTFKEVFEMVNFRFHRKRNTKSKYGNNLFNGNGGGNNLLPVWVNGASKITITSSERSSKL